MKTTRRILYSITAIIIFLVLCSNSYYFRKFVVLCWVPEENLSYSYTTLNAEFQANDRVNWKQGETPWDTVQSRFKRYVYCHPTTSDTVLYRTFKKDGWQFWNWVGYLTHPRYKLPYVAPNTIPFAPDRRPPNICEEEF